MSLYGLILGICFVIGINYFSNHNHLLRKNQENIFILFLIIFSIIGARLYHVIDNWAYYSQNLIQIPQTWNGGLGIYGGLIGGFLYLVIFSLILKIPLINILDLISPILPLCQSIGRLGNFFNHEIPIWWLESFLCLILYFIISKLKNRFSPTGLYFLGYGLIRFSTEFFRTDTWQISYIKVAQIISLILILAGISILFTTRSVLYHSKSNMH
jgi:phosphatidylglycerol---prolipoprotein diacylglyceryl transferase